MRKFRYRLGLDVGVQSIGWAVLPVDPLKFERLKLGVHCFESGTGTESDIEKGTDESRNTARRMARSARRLLRRRSQRMVRLANELKRIGLLPDCRMRVPEERNRMLQELDQELSVFCAVGDRREAHLLPYILRARALDQPLPEHAVGRALYHLAIRRGFLSNRKTQGKDEEEGQVKPAIQKLDQEIQKANCRTLGEYFSQCDPEDVRVRQRWTSREMHEKEFGMIWDSQARFHPEMTEEAKKRVHHAIFFQRPLKSQKFLIGKCRLEPQHRRAPAASLEMQRFRYWQKILDLTYTIGDGLEEFSLTPEQQDLLAEILENTDSLTFPEVAKLLGFKSSQKVEFNLQRGGEKKLLGNTTSFRLGKVLPDRWPKMTEAEKKTLVDEILQYQSESGLRDRLEKAYGFTPDEAAKVAATRLEGDYGSLSRRAISKILPLMIEKRINFKTAENILYPQRAKAEEVVDFLPPLCKDKGCVLTNPVVTRALTELRKVVNAIIREYGKPERIVVELARDLKRSRKEREAIWKKARKQETLRTNAKTKIQKEMHIQEPSNLDILKVMLAEECDWKCPYTGKTIKIEALLSKKSPFDIEHILPFSRSMDNSFANKTLCDEYENRHVKKNQTPYEAYHGTDRWPEFEARIKKLFQDKKIDRAKLEHFLAPEISNDFANRALNDTRYISRQATTYLAKLELPDEGAEMGKRRIFTCNGQATAWLRDEWGLNGILNKEEDRKNRSDHRHHAIDALVVAFCNQTIVEQLSRAAEASKQYGKFRLFNQIDQPRPNFLKVVRKAVEQINVSYRSSRKVSGALHEETNYSKPFRDPDSENKIHYKRVPLQNLKEKDIPLIVDGGIRRIVEQKFKEIKDFKKLTPGNTRDFPFREVTTKEGETYKIYIKSVRLKTSVSAQQIGHGPSTRYVKTGSNHHMEVVAVLDKQGNEIRWEGVIVTMFEAYQRHKNGEPIVKRDHGPGKRFKFSLFKNEFLLKTEEDGSKTLYRVFKMSKNAKGAVCIGWGKHTDARPAQEVTNKTPGNIKSINPLMGQVIKVKVDHLGRIHPTND